MGGNVRGQATVLWTGWSVADTIISALGVGSGEP